MGDKPHDESSGRRRLTPAPTPRSSKNGFRGRRTGTELRAVIFKAAISVFDIRHGSFENLGSTLWTCICSVPEGRLRSGDVLVVVGHDL